MVSNIFYFHPYLGKISNLTSIFFKGVETTNQKMGGLSSPLALYSGGVPEDIGEAGSDDEQVLEDSSCASDVEEQQWSLGALTYEHPVLALPTGTGKSTYFLAQLAFQENGHVIAIMPSQEQALKSSMFLKQHHVLCKTEELAVSAQTATSHPGDNEPKLRDGLAGSPSVVFTVLGTVQRQLDNLVPVWQNSKRPVRVFLDEIHQGAEGNNPAQLALLQLLKRMKVSCILSTGTPDKSWVVEAQIGPIFRTAEATWIAPAYPPGEMIQFN